jgi:hypothetical protein
MKRVVDTCDRCGVAETRDPGTEHKISRYWAVVRVSQADYYGNQEEEGSQTRELCRGCASKLGEFFRKVAVGS